VFETGFVTHKVVAERCNMGKQFGAGFFQQMTVFWWNAIPRFWHALMNVINGIKIHILNVPAERSFPHAKI
jgi:hypothetical protein